MRVRPARLRCRGGGDGRMDIHMMRDSYAGQRTKETHNYVAHARCLITLGKGIHICTHIACVKQEATVQVSKIENEKFFIVSFSRWKMKRFFYSFIFHNGK